MRIALLSAHYPPDFVSGGTLQPQRLARALRGLGHEVIVLAGSLDPERAPLEVWDTVDDTGLDVRWVASGPFIAWDDERNYDNPGVTRVAESLFDSWHPDVVHAHSLQGLGVGPIDAAAERGIPVVVTMHDFWWICARQFLVDRDDRPCPVIVDASDCSCQAGRAHLDARAARLRRSLALVDRVLVPSRAAAAVLAANLTGVADPQVDENGVPEPAADVPVAHTRRADGQPLVIRYTGGGNAMKGADVLLDAASRLPSDLPMRIIGHGIDDALSRRPAGEPTGLPVEAAPAYLPDELDAILADTDVLVLPSIMRETFSIVTREALSRGVPVLATDTLGPEEVVVDGVNGRVLPAGDAGTLAEALTAIALQPEEVEHWRSRIGSVALRSVDDQAAGLLEHYAAVLAGAGTAEAAPWRPDRVLFVVGIDGAPLRYRAHLPAEALRSYGITADVRHYRDPDVADLARAASAVVVYRVPGTPQILELVGELRGRGVPTAFDVDDLIFDPALHDEIPALRILPEPEVALWLDGVSRYRTTMEACDAFIGSTPALVAHAEAVTGLPAFLAENGVGALLGRASDRAAKVARSPGPLRIGFLSGTTTHDEDWAFVEPAVLEALERHPGVELWLGGHLQTGPAIADHLGPRLRRIPFTRWDRLPQVLRDLDVNLAPLSPASRFNEAKSAIKWLEAALVGTPTVASSTEPFRRAIDDGRTGILASSPADWTSALDQLLSSSGARARMGAAAQRAALVGWSPAQQGARYLETLRGVRAAAGRPRPPSTWVPVTVDEPPLIERVPLEPYELDTPPAPAPPGTSAPGPVQAWAGTLGRAAHTLRHEGLGAAVARARRSVAHRRALRRAR